MKTLKELGLKKLFIFFIAAIVATSCGSDNENGDPAPPPPANNNNCSNSSCWNNDYVNPGVQNFNAFKDQVIRGNFRGLSGYSYISYLHCGVETNQINSFSDFFDGWFDISFTWNSWDSSRCGNATQYDIVHNVQTGGVTGHRHGSSATAVHNKLKSIVNSPDYARQYNATTFEVISGGRTYLIDLAQPLVANPVVEFPVSGAPYFNINGNGFQYVGTSIAY
jgi:hypothetical protein